MENNEYLYAFKQAIDAILDRLDELDKKMEDNNQYNDERMHKLEECLYNEILEPVHSLYDDRARKDRRSAFGDKYKEQLDPYCEDYKKLYGDDLDLYDDSFEEWDKLESDEDKDEYIKKVMETIGTDRDRMKSKFGTPVVEEVSVEVEPEEKKTDEEEAVEGEEKDNEPTEDEKENQEWEETAKMLKKYRK